MTKHRDLLPWDRGLEPRVGQKSVDDLMICVKKTSHFSLDFARKYVGLCGYYRPMTETNFIFENRPNDIATTELEVEGTIPAALRGRFLFNGPGRSQVNGQKLHVFDAHGRIVSARLRDGRVTLSGKHVQTPPCRDLPCSDRH